MRSVPLTVLLFFSVLASISTTSKTSAHSPSDPSLVGNISRLTEESTFVFRGKAVDVQYRNLNSPLGKVPHTFVTYEVVEVISGAPPDRVVLRFTGGPDGMGSILSVTGVPHFQAGDEDILFVSNNGMDITSQQPCALVGCEFGRYRVVDGAVYETHGSPVVSVRSGRIITQGMGPIEVLDRQFPAPKFDDMMKRPEFAARVKSLGLTITEAREQYNRKTPKNLTIRQLRGEQVSANKNGDLNSSGKSRRLGTEVTLPVRGASVSIVSEAIKQEIKAAGVTKSVKPGRQFRNAYVTSFVPLSNSAAAPPPGSSSDELMPKVTK